jgi:hypothetical protein
MSGEVGGHGLSKPDSWTFCRHRCVLQPNTANFAVPKPIYSTFEKPGGLKSDLRSGRIN